MAKKFFVFILFFRNDEYGFKTKMQVKMAIGRVGG